MKNSRAVATATWGLFVGLAFLMLGGGLFGTILGIRSERVGLPTFVSSAISASYYVGFLVGSVLTLRALGRVGHIRVYAALASTLAAGMIGVGITHHASLWIAMRLVTGVCSAGLYVVAESWLNGMATNQNRGRLMAVYSVITTLFWGVGQFSVSVFDSRVAAGFGVAAILTSLAVAPVSLSESAEAPAVEDSEHISLRDLARATPTGVYSCLLVGIAHGGLSGMAAIYATRVGLSAAGIGLYVALPSLGGVLLAWPVSAASDDLDRRAVGVAISVGSAIAAALLLLGRATHPMALVLITLLGALSYPLYAISAAYTNDWVEPEHTNAAAGQLVKLYGIGAIVGPFTAGAAMSFFGPKGFYWELIGVHALLAVFFTYRMFAWRSPFAKRPWDEVSLPARAFFVPATIISIGLRRASRGSSAARQP